MKPVEGPYETPALTLRPILEGDLETTLAWRNRDDARVWFKTTAQLSLDQHRSWFQRYVEKSDDLLFVVEVAGEVVGQVSVYDIDPESRSGEVGRFLVASGHGGRGYMRAAISALLELCAKTLALRYVFLEVKAANERAKRIYSSLGFTEEASTGDLVRMGKRLNES